MKGDIIIYLDTDSNKRRPGVIIGDGLTVADLDITIAKVTSQSVRNEFDVQVEHWEESGLKKPSVVRCSKITTLKPKQVLYKVATLHESDFQKVRDAVAKYLFD